MAARIVTVARWILLIPATFVVGIGVGGSIGAIEVVIGIPENAPVQYFNIWLFQSAAWVLTGYVIAPAWKRLIAAVISTLAFLDAFPLSPDVAKAYPRQDFEYAVAGALAGLIFTWVFILTRQRGKRSA